MLPVPLTQFEIPEVSLWNVAHRQRDTAGFQNPINAQGQAMLIQTSCNPDPERPHAAACDKVHSAGRSGLALRLHQWLLSGPYEKVATDRQ